MQEESEQKMSNSTRQNAIMEILKTDKFARVNELSQILYTSPSSIRRDLNSLAKKGLVKRNHGGVVLAEGYIGVPAFDVRVKKNMVGKKRAASKAASLLKDNMSIMIDGSSSTSIYMLEYIKQLKNVTVISNNTKVVSEASENGIKAICLGGEAQLGSDVLLGAYTVECAKNFYPDILFFSSQYIDDDGNITDYSLDDVVLRKTMMSNSKISVFLCDGDKLGKRSVHKLCNISQVDYVAFDCEIATEKFKEKVKVL